MNLNTASESRLQITASEHRLWRAACYNRLGNYDESQASIEIDQLYEQRYVMNKTLQFFAGKLQLEDMIDFIGSSDERDQLGVRFFGNFYLGLFYNSMKEFTLAKLFSSIPANSNRYPVVDMWHHLPKVLDDLSTQEDGNDNG